MKNWRSVQVRTALLKNIEGLIADGNTSISNVTQFTDLAIREKLERLGVMQK